eukprot:TRINITY_DN34_c4_g1_i1.p2 TRINITY_DN34_c4_g1~~TRINITY_DN34_c4_g1_i1.p2  ORF type:complete len:537 (+),score=160.34 TRINITY_DN34_c4_g1_i1:66-1676(+)
MDPAMCAAPCGEQGRRLSPNRGVRTPAAFDLTAMAGSLALDPRPGGGELPPAPDFAAFAAAAEDAKLHAALQDAGRTLSAAAAASASASGGGGDGAGGGGLSAEERVGLLEELLAKEKRQAEELRRRLRERELRDLARERRQIAAVGQHQRAARTPQAAPPQSTSGSTLRGATGGAGTGGAPSTDGRSAAAHTGAASPPPRRELPPPQLPAAASPSPRTRRSDGERPRRQSWRDDPGVGTLKTDLHGVQHLLGNRDGARAQKWTSAWAHGLRGGPEWEDADEDFRQQTGRPPWRGVSWHDRRATRSRCSPRRQRSATPRRQSPQPRRADPQLAGAQPAAQGRQPPQRTPEAGHWITGGGGSLAAAAVVRSISTPANMQPSPSRSTGDRSATSRRSKVPPRQADPGVGTLKTDLHSVQHLLGTRQGARAEKWTSAWAHGLRGGQDAEDEIEETRRVAGRPPWCGVSWHQRRATRTWRRSASPEHSGGDAVDGAVFSASDRGVSPMRGGDPAPDRAGCSDPRMGPAARDPGSAPRHTR